jgi:hypothetical protein
MKPPDSPIATLPALKLWLGSLEASQPLTLEPSYFKAPGETASSLLADRLFERLGPVSTIALSAWTFAEQPGGNVTVTGTAALMNVPAAGVTATFQPASAGTSLLITVKLDLGPTETWGIHDLLTAVHLGNIRLNFAPNETLGLYVTSIDAVLNCGNLSVAMGVHVPPYDADWMAYGKFLVEGATAPGMSVVDMVDLVAGHDFRGDLQNDHLKALLDSAKLQDVQIAFDPAAATLSHVSVVVSMPGPWNFISSLSARDLAMEVIVPFRANRPNQPFVKLSAAMDIGSGASKVALLLDAQFPDRQLSMALDPNTPLSLSPLFSHFGADLPPWVGNPVIDLLTVNVDLEESAIGFHVMVTDEVQLLAGVALKSLTLELDHSAATGWTGMFSAFTEVGGNHPVVVSAAYSQAGGMTLKGNYTHAAALGEPPFTVGVWLAAMASRLGIQAPACLHALVLNEFDLEFNTATKNLSFTLSVDLPIDGQAHPVRVHLEVTHDHRGAVQWRFQVALGGLRFELRDQADLILASYMGNVRLAPKQLAASVSSAVAAVIPDGIELTIKDAFFLHQTVATPPNSGKFLFGIELGAGFDLSALPLVGRAFSGNTLTVDQLKFVIASKEFTYAEVTAINAALPSGIVVPVPQDPAAGTLPSGPTVTAQLSWIGQTLPVFMGAGAPTAAAPAGGVTATPPVDSAKWFTIDRSFGPVHLQRVGAQYQNGELAFLLDGTLGAGGVSLSLIGLQVGSPLAEFKPKFDLRGLGLSITAGSVGISGAFLHIHHDAAGTVPAYDEYAGTALITLTKLTLGAIGSYAELDGHPSLFIYAVLDMPIGGPSFFFVTGLAAGFGYNRGLRMPAIDQVAQFPLIQEAVSGARNLNLAAELQSLQQYIPPSVGDQFLAIGVKFTSFKMIESFALLSVSWGHRVEVDILGLSTLVVPTREGQGGPDPLAMVQLALKATFLPDPGFLGVSAQLTASSYILSKACHLTGGFAFYSWFGGEHEGDFVLSLGGYHPNYRPPAHYPQVPRLGFNWQVTSELSLSGQAYFALVPSAVMAGGRLEAVWQSGDLRAWFIAGADFLISWKPYHYEAHIYVDMGVSYTFSFFGRHTITVQVGADLAVWGPEFAGEAKVHLWIVSFTVAFGPKPTTSRAPIAWSSFQTMLPASQQRLSIAVEGGLVRKGPTASTGPVHLGAINPKDLVLSIQSAVPISSVVGITLPGTPAPFGITPMNRTVAASTLTLRISGPTAFSSATAITKPQPSALWGNGGMDGTGRELTAPLLCGIRLVAPKVTEPAATPSIERAKLGFETALKRDAIVTPAAGAWVSAATLQTLGTSTVNFADWPSEPVANDYFSALLRRGTA